jgi:hypothetical protein
VSQKRIFNEDNVETLLGHLSPGSFEHEVVIAASSAMSKDEAQATLAAILKTRVAAVREELDADS